MQNLTSFHPELLKAQSLVYEPTGFRLDNIVQEPESEDYGAFRFQINGLNIIFRVAKITPTKIGQFVTLWKRIGQGPIMPFDGADEVDLVVVSVRHGDQWGHFVFPKAVLMAQDVFSHEGKDGKRAIRVYPPWDRTNSAQAKRTQKWQLQYFFAIRDDKAMDFEKIKNLFS